jgi:Na+-driven multidrug efflux pump
MGITGVWLAMTLDLSVRFLLTLLRYRSGKWKNTLSDIAVVEVSAN